MASRHQRRSILTMTSAVLAASAARAQGGPSVRIDFEATPVGQLPAGVTTALTGSGGPVKWSVIEDPTAPAGSKVLAQTSADRTDLRFPLAIFEPVVGDAAVAVKFRAVSGEVDRAGGIALRLQRCRQLLRRACQCARGQCATLPSSSAANASSSRGPTPRWHRHLARTRLRGARQSIRGDLQRQEPLHRDRHHLRTARPRCAVDQGRQRHPLRRPHHQVAVRRTTAIRYRYQCERNADLGY